MKKYILILLVALAAVFTSCKEEKYSVYNFGFDNWSNSENVNTTAMDKVYEKIADQFIISGYVYKGYQIEGNDITVNDTQAIFYFDQNMKNLKEIDVPIIEKALQGTEGAPFTVEVKYMLYRGSTTQALVKSEPLIIKVEPKPAN